MKSLSPRLSYFDAVKKILASPEELDALAAAGLDMGDDLVKPLGLLRLLYGVPFHHLVPEERMLPPECIRFFHLDPDWMACLMEGALSPGRSVSRKADSLGYVIEKMLLREADKRSSTFARRFRSARLGLPAVGDGTGPPGEVTGFLLRSDAVRGWKNMGVNAYPKGGTPADAVPAPLPILRFERLSDDTLLALFQGTIHRADIHEAPQGLHFGVDPGPAKSLKYDQAFGAHRLGDPVPNASVSVPFRDEQRRVVDIHRLAKELRGALDRAQERSVAENPAPLPSPDFALQMIRGVGLVSFTVNLPGAA